jgi:hypothetical protein
VVGGVQNPPENFRRNGVGEELSADVPALMDGAVNTALFLF